MVERMRERSRSVLSKYLEQPVARALHRLGLTPNVITVTGFLMVLPSAVLASMGHLRIAGIIFLVAGALDLFDGALARLTKNATPFGAMLDSLMDRLGEAALYLGLAIYAVRIDPGSRNLTVFMTILILTLAGSQAVSLPSRKGRSPGNRHPRRPRDSARKGNSSIRWVDIGRSYAAPCHGLHCLLFHLDYAHPAYTHLAES